MENKILNLIKKIIKEDEDTFIDITNMDNNTAVEMVEKLHGGQKKLDKNKNDKIDADDFKKLRKTKSGVKEYDMSDNQIKKNKMTLPEVDGRSLPNGSYRDYNVDPYDPVNNPNDSEVDSYQPGVYPFKDTRTPEEKEADGLKSYNDSFKPNVIPKKKGLMSRVKDFFKEGEDDDKKRKPKKPRTPAGFEYGEIVSGEMGEENDMYLGIGDRGFYDSKNREYTGNFDFDYDEEEFDTYDDFMSKYGNKQRFFAPERSDANYQGRKSDGRRMFDAYREKYGEPFKLRTRRSKLSEDEVEEGNAFSGALANAKKEGKSSFEVDGKNYPVKESKNKIVFTESELINFIERLVEEEKVVDKGFKSAMNTSKKENTDAMKQVAAKMKDYMKNMGTEYEEKPKSFPKGNKIMSREDFGKETSDDKKKAYSASDAVEEYIDAFAYPGQTNLVFDEIKPDDTKIEKYLKGHSTTGNAVVDEEGNPLGNVVPSKVGEKFYKNYQDNLYGAEQMNASYKRQPAPVDVAGEGKSTGSLKNLKSMKKSQQIFDKLGESVEDKKVISEMEKMKNLIGYNRKTQ